MKQALLLFDIDGTLLTTRRAGIRAMERVAAALFDRAWDWSGIAVAGRLDPQIFADAARANGVDDPDAHHGRFCELYIEYLKEELIAGAGEVRALAGVLGVLERLRARRADRGDVVLGLLTGNYSRAAPMKIAAVGMDPAWFTLTAFGDEAVTRRDLVALAMRKYKANVGVAVEPRRVVVIGDTPNDVDCATAHGCTAFGVATGKYGIDELREAGADWVVSDLSDPGHLMDVIDGVLESTPTA